MQTTRKATIIIIDAQEHSERELAPEERQA